MLNEFIKTLKANYEGTQIESELGVWHFSVEDDGTLNWNLEDLSMTGRRVLVDDIGYQGDDQPTVFITCKFDSARRVMVYRMHAAPPGFAPRSLTSSYIQFGPTRDVEDSAINYLDLMSSLFMLADDSLKKFANMWFKQRTVRFNRAGNMMAKTGPSEKLGSKQPLSLKTALEGDDENAIIRAARGHVLTAKELVAIYDKAHDMRSNKLINFIRQVRTESAANSIRRLLT